MGIVRIRYEIGESRGFIGIDSVDDLLVLGGRVKSSFKRIYLDLKNYLFRYILVFFYRETCIYFS